VTWFSPRLDDMTDRTIYIACASDKNFVMPLTVMLVSLFTHLDQSRKAVVYILDGGISTLGRNNLLKSLKAKNADIRFIKISDHNPLNGMIVSGHISIASYYRLMIPSLVPENIKKIIYLDADLILNADIARLWDIDIAEKDVLAVQDQAKDFLYVSSPGGLLNYKELGLNPANKYFNAGVLVMNLDNWRKDSLSQKVIEYIQENRKYIRWWDQDGMNAVLANKWGELDHRWNLVINIFLNPTWEQGPVKDKKQYDELVGHPYIVHFVYRDKPWKYGYKYPYLDLFINYLARTPWYWPWKIRMCCEHVLRPIKRFIVLRIKEFNANISQMSGLRNNLF